ncbi:MAG: MazG nucleotide pyrophosphohydrolase domain-containing protein [Candidatus Dojkabacteria bacterium]
MSREKITVKELREHTEKVTQILVDKYNVDVSDSSTKYIQLAKIQEELGELADAVLSMDNNQRTSKGQKNIEDVSKEIFDVLLATTIMANLLRIDIEKLIIVGILEYDEERD